METVDWKSLHTLGNQSAKMTDREIKWCYICRIIPTCFINQNWKSVFPERCSGGELLGFIVYLLRCKYFEILQWESMFKFVWEVCASLGNISFKQIETSPESETYVVVFFCPKLTICLRGDVCIFHKFSLDIIIDFLLICLKHFLFLCKHAWNNKASGEKAVCSKLEV